jgi:hypothetical protein
MLKPDSDPGDKFNVNPAEPDPKNCLSDKPSMLVALSIRYQAYYAYQAHEAVRTSHNILGMLSLLCTTTIQYLAYRT